ncbi:MAG: hypothetical protein Ta2D_07760 [Rickettsiales bacterium]|nr:MAG: hypothetical protein Ta2D_07760 [Rickettsiales bacterium]
MQLSKIIKDNIKKEFETFKERMYNGKSKEERQKLGQFFTPPSLTIKMLEKFTNIEGGIIDPCCGAGNLLVGVFFAKMGDNYIYEKDFCSYKDIKKAINEIYGIEIDYKILDIVKNRLKNICKNENLNEIIDKNIHWGNALIDECYDFGEIYNDFLKQIKLWDDCKTEEQINKKLNTICKKRQIENKNEMDLLTSLKQAI